MSIILYIIIKRCSGQFDRFMNAVLKVHRFYRKSDNLENSSESSAAVKIDFPSMKQVFLIRDFGENVEYTFLALKTKRLLYFISSSLKIL